MNSRLHRLGIGFQLTEYQLQFCNELLFMAWLNRTPCRRGGIRNKSVRSFRSQLYPFRFQFGLNFS